MMSREEIERSASALVEVAADILQRYESDQAEKQRLDAERKRLTAILDAVADWNNSPPGERQTLTSILAGQVPHVTAPHEQEAWANPLSLREFRG